MTAITVIVFIIALVLFILAIISLSKRIEKSKFPQQQNVEDDNLQTKLNQWDIFLIIISGLLIVFSISAPLLFTRKALSDDFNFMASGQVGDTIGGLMSPFINLAAVIVTGLAFYMQYRANKLQVDIFRNQLKKDQQKFKEEQNEQKKDTQFKQFESQFYEMLRLHKENVNEIEIEAKKRKRVKRIKSQKPGSQFIEAKYTFERTTYENDYVDYIVSKRNAFVEMQSELEFMISEIEGSDTAELTFEVFQNLYEIYFWGIDGKEVYESDPELKSKKIGSILVNSMLNQYESNISKAKTLPFTIPAFRGHSNFLGHYYRHLFHTVKFVANYDEEIVDKNKKKELLRLLRAQLSNHEQALLFYNWLAKYGSAWENDENKFLTEYRMIHNLWYGDLPQKPFITKKLHELVTKYKSLGHTDDLFEMGDAKILNS